MTRLRACPPDQSERPALAEPFVTVVILHWRNADDTLRAVDAALRSRYRRFRVSVVANGPEDDNLRSLLSACSVDVFSTGSNLGYAGGNNWGIRRALADGSDYILLLNDDTVVNSETLAELVVVAGACPNAGLVGPVVLDVGQRDRIVSAGGRLGCDGTVVHFREGERYDACGEVALEVDFVSGCAVLASRRMLDEVGFLDEDYFAYWEDVDWCYRAREAGLGVLLATRSCVWHPNPRCRDEKSGSVTYYCARNQLIFARKHRLGASVVGRIVAADTQTILSWLVQRRWRGKRLLVRSLVAALVDFALGRYGPAPARVDGVGRATGDSGPL